MKYAIIGATFLAACATGSGQIEAVAFCASYANSIERAAYMNVNDLLSTEEVATVDLVRDTVGPFCLAPAPGEAVPETAVDMLDRLLLILVTKGV